MAKPPFWSPTALSYVLSEGGVAVFRVGGGEDEDAVFFAPCSEVSRLVIGGDAECVNAVGHAVESERGGLHIGLAPVFLFRSAIAHFIPGDALVVPRLLPGQDRTGGFPRGVDEIDPVRRVNVKTLECVFGA